MVFKSKKTISFGMVCLRRYYPLAQKVLAVAVINYYNTLPNYSILYDWTVYVDAVQGKNHAKECFAVEKFGDKLRKDIAERIFPFLDVNKFRE